MKVLFIAHDAFRAGAQMALIHLIRWLIQNRNVSAEVLLLQNGVLESDFRELGVKVYVLTKKEITKNNLIKRIYNKIFQRPSKNKVLYEIDKNSFDLVYINSVACSWFLAQNVDFQLGVPKIMHVHELEIAIAQFAGKSNFMRAKIQINHFIAASRAVRNNLIKGEYGIDENRLQVCYEYVDFEQIKLELSDNEKSNISSSNQTTFTVGGCGTLDWRKGIDLFLMLASSFKSADGVKFIWVGGNEKSIEFQKVLYDVKRLELDDFFTLIPSTKDRFIQFKKFDLFFLSSREDPFPLVCIENAFLGNPIICFENSGGMPEFVNEGCGFIVKYGQIDEVKRIILELNGNRKLLMELSKNATETATHYSVDNIAPQIFDQISKIVHEK